MLTIPVKHDIEVSQLYPHILNRFRPHLDYGDIIYDQAYNASFHQKLDSIQYNAALAITGAIRGTSKEKLYDELGLETLEKRRWYRKLCCFFKIFRYKCSKYLFNIILTSVSTSTQEILIIFPYSK